MADRCTGHCCRRFHLYVTIDEIQKDLDEGKRRFDPEEARKLVAMLVPLPVEEGDNIATDREGFFTCRHLHTITGDCLNYENRPKLCSDYPYDHACTFKGCTWDEGRNRCPPDVVVKQQRVSLPVV